METAVTVVPDAPPKSIEEDIAFAQNAAKHLMNIVNECDLAVKIRKERHIKFEGWSTIASFYGFVLGAESVSPIYNRDVIVGFKALGTVRDGQGVTVNTASASCYCDEENWRGKPLFQVESMAQTRAAGKAARMMFSRVAVLAGYSPTPFEEMTVGNDKSAKKDEKKKKSNGGRKITEKQVGLVWGKAYGVWDDREEAQKEVKGILRGRYKIESTSDMTQEQLDDYLEYIERVKVSKDQQQDLEYPED